MAKKLPSKKSGRRAAVFTATSQQKAAIEKPFAAAFGRISAFVRYDMPSA
jgi:hypothetical protein